MASAATDDAITITTGQSSAAVLPVAKVQGWCCCGEESHRVCRRWNIYELAKSNCGVLCAGAEGVIMCLGGVVMLAHVMVHVVVCFTTVRFARVPTVAHLRALLWTMGNTLYQYGL